MGVCMKAIVLFGVVVLLLAALVAAEDVPLFPTQFFGSVLINGVNVPTGTELVARIFNQQKGNFTIVTSGQYGGSEGFDPKLVVNPGNVSDVISFFVKKPTMNGFVAAQQTASYDQSIHQLALTAASVCSDAVCDSELESCSSCAADCGSCPSSGGSSGGTGGSSGGTGGSTDGSSGSSSGSVGGSLTTNVSANGSSPSVTAPPVTALDTSALCEPGFKLCVGNEVYTCGANRSWSFSEVCASGCSGGVCLSPSPAAPSPEVPLAFTGNFLQNIATKETGVLVVVVVAILIVLAKIVVF